MPIYEYECRKCGHVFERIEPHSDLSWKALKNKKYNCLVCGENSAVRVPSKFKLGTKVLETKDKSGYETDDLTLGKLIDEGGIPYEEKARLRKREKLITRQKKYTKTLKERAKKYNFDPYGDD